MNVKTIVPTLLFLMLSISPSHSEELITLPTREGVEQGFIIVSPESPVASVILFAGGKGALGLSSSVGTPSINWGKKNFLVRSRALFWEHGFTVAVVDAPSDHQSKKGMLGGFRDSAEHVQDIDYVIDYLRAKADVPVWLVGTSRGTESAVNVAIASRQSPAGLILTSSMSEENSKGTAVTEMELASIRMPTLVIANTDDACRKTPPEGADEIAAMLFSAKKVEVKKFSGGDRPQSKPCKAMSYHGFLGIEDQVVDHIAGFIRSN